MLPHKFQSGQMVLEKILKISQKCSIFLDYLPVIINFYNFKSPLPMTDRHNAIRKAFSTGEIVKQYAYVM